MESNFIWEDLKFFVDTLKSLPVSESLTLSENGSYCVSTNTDFENWVYCPEYEITSEMADEAARFFRERGESFMWPVYDGCTEILEGAGLVYAGDLTAMCFPSKSAGLDLKTNGNVNANTQYAAANGLKNSVLLTIQQVSSLETAGIWAETAAHGFGEDVTPEYMKFVKSLCGKHERVRLHLAKYKGEYAGTF